MAADLPVCEAPGWTRRPTDPGVIPLPRRRLLTAALGLASADRSVANSAPTGPSSRGRSGVAELVLFACFLVRVVLVDTGAIGMMRLMRLVIPEMAIDAVLGEQFLVRAALDRPAAGYDDDLVHLNH
jgi:hypothetical protein